MLPEAGLSMTSLQRHLILAVVTAVRSTAVTYPSCPHCYSKLLSDTTNSSWHCLKCRYYFHGCEVPKRYRLAMTVADDTDIDNLTVFGKILDTFFGTSATDFHRKFMSLNRPDIDKDFLLHEALSYAFVGQHFYFGLKTWTGSGTVRLRNVFNHKTDTKQRHSQFTSQLDPSDIIAYQMLPSCNTNMPTVCDYVKFLLAYNSQNLSLSSQVFQRKNCDDHCHDNSDDPTTFSQSPGSKSEKYDSSSVFAKQSEVVFSFELDQTISQSSTSKSIDPGKKVRPFSQKSRTGNSEGLNYSLGSDGNGSWSSSSVESPGMCNDENTSEYVPSASDPFDSLTYTNLEMNQISSTHDPSLIKFRSHRCKTSCSESSEKLSPASRKKSSMDPGMCVKETRNGSKLEAHHEQSGCSLNRYISKSENSLQFQQPSYLHKQQLRSEKDDTDHNMSTVVSRSENQVYADVIRDDTVEKASMKLSFKQSNVGLDIESFSSSSDSLLLMAIDNMNVYSKEREAGIKETFLIQNPSVRDQSTTHGNLSNDAVNVPEKDSIVNSNKTSFSSEIQSQNYSKLTKSNMLKDGQMAVQQSLSKTSQSKTKLLKNDQFPVKQNTSKRGQSNRRPSKTNQITTMQSTNRQSLREDPALLRNRQSKKDQSAVILRESDHATLKEGPRSITNSSLTLRQVSNSSRQRCKSDVPSNPSSVGLERESRCGDNVLKKKQISKKKGIERSKQSNSRSVSYTAELNSWAYLSCGNQKAPNQGPNIKPSSYMTLEGNEFTIESDCDLSSREKSLQSPRLTQAEAIGSIQLNMPESEGMEAFLSSQLDELILKESASNSSIEVQPHTPVFTKKERTSKNTCIVNKEIGEDTSERMKMMAGRLIGSKVDNHLSATKTGKEQNSECSNLPNSSHEEQKSEDINNLDILKIIQQRSSQRKQSKAPTHSQSGTKESDKDIHSGPMVDMPESEDIYAFLESFSELSASLSYKNSNGNVRNQEETISGSGTADCQHRECLVVDTCICEDRLRNSGHQIDLTHSNTFAKRRNQEVGLRNGKTLKPNESFDIENKYMSSDLVLVKGSNAEKWKEAKRSDITKHLASDDPEMFSESLEAFLENSDVFQDRVSSANLQILSQTNNVKKKQNNLSSEDKDCSAVQPKKGALNPYNCNFTHSSSCDALSDDFKLDPKYYSFTGNDLSESKCFYEVQQGSETLATALETCTEFDTSFVPHPNRQVQCRSHGAAFIFHLSSPQNRMDIKESRVSCGGSQDLFDSSGISVHDTSFGHNEQVDNVSNVSLFSSSPLTPAGHFSTPNVSTRSKPMEPAASCIASGILKNPSNWQIGEWSDGHEDLELDDDFSGDIDLFLMGDSFSSSCKEHSIRTAYITETRTTINHGVKGHSCSSNLKDGSLVKIGKAKEESCASVILGSKPSSTNKMKETLHILDKYENSEELSRKSKNKSNSKDLKEGARTVNKVVHMMNKGNLQACFDNSGTSPSTTNESTRSPMAVKNTKGIKLATNVKGRDTSGSDNSRKRSSRTDATADFSNTPGDRENICAESMIISECDTTCGSSNSADLLETGSKPQSKKVKFHSRLRRVSTIQIIDMKMKLTASPIQRPDANPVTLKSCLKTGKDLIGKNNNKVSSSTSSPIVSQDLFNSDSFEVPKTPIIVLSETSTDDSLIPGTPCAMSVTGKENIPSYDRPIEAQASSSKRMNKESQVKHQYASLKLGKAKNVSGKQRFLQQGNCDVLKDMINLPIRTPCLFSDESIGSHDRFSSECLKQKKSSKTRTSTFVGNQPCASPHHLNRVISPQGMTIEVSPDLFSPSPSSNWENDIPKLHQISSLHSYSMQDDLCKNLFS